MAAYLAYRLENVAIHHLREITHTRYTACVNRYLIPGLGKKKLTKLTAKDVHAWLNQLRTTCQCCVRGIDGPVMGPVAVPSGSAAASVATSASLRLFRVARFPIPQERIKFIEENSNRFAAFTMRVRNPKVVGLTWVSDSDHQNPPCKIGTKTRPRS